ncbi:MAG: cytochrome b/b6 domain-containing protein [Hyphomicrobiales bacterium]|nr:cytochrome b/b6 domain-containing protein [Hyphomicrobiales bacterium]MCY4033921.1 cytochrome b/b6 domain-containing protein [Hyphomicrobiales bacterium]MCY4039540.1 cytochrome b/b6 domain-containing protein [Hyphomicrobiales bacterium]
MSLKSSSNQYGTVAVTIHWLSALFILVLIGSGWLVHETEDLATKADILKVHVSLGVLVLLLTLARIAWWKFFDSKPEPVPMARWQDRAARTVHVLLYIVLLVMAASGIGMMVLSGAAPVIFGISTGTLPDFWDYPPRIPHEIGGKLIIALFVVHAGAALYHHFVQRDGLLDRMWYRKRGEL